jgi:hypothetical protein
VGIGVIVRRKVDKRAVAEEICVPLGAHSVNLPMD